MVEHLRVDPAALAPRRDDDTSARADPGRRRPPSGGARSAVPGGMACVNTRRRCRTVASPAGLPVRVRAAGAAGGGTWSKKPSFSSKFTSSTVLRPHLGIGRQRVQHRRGVVGALHRARRARVLGVRLGRDDPRHLRQAAGDHVGPERLQEPAVGHRVGDPLDQRVDGLELLVVHRVRRAIGTVAHRRVRPRKFTNPASELSLKLSGIFWYTFQLTPACSSRSG